MLETDIVIIGAGIIGLSIAKELHDRYPDVKITVIEKEASLGFHASGRNSGVIHSGFYYTPDSLKARFTVEGNRLLVDYCQKHHLIINRCGKIVVTKKERELDSLYELKRRGEENGVILELINEKELTEIEPNAKTFQYALYSPSTAVVDPGDVLVHIARDFKGSEKLLLNERFIKRSGISSIETNRQEIKYKYLINAAGLYADKIAHQYGVGQIYTLIPFKGLYVKYKDNSLIRKPIYPVPNLKNPFLGVHFTVTIDGSVKIGPTAIPALWRENYQGFSNFNLGEFFEIFCNEAKLFFMNSFNFRALAWDEVKKYYRKYFINQATDLVKKIDVHNFGHYLRPGIRAQLLNREKMQLEMDFVLEHGENSTHVLNAVSPAFTSAFSFSKHVVDIVGQRMKI